MSIPIAEWKEQLLMAPVPEHVKARIAYVFRNNNKAYYKKRYAAHISLHPRKKKDNFPDDRTARVELIAAIKAKRK